MNNENIVIKPVRIKLKHGKDPQGNIKDEVDKALGSLKELDKKDFIFVCCDADILGNHEAKVKRTALLKTLWQNYHNKIYNKVQMNVIIWNMCIETWFLMHLGHVKRYPDAAGYRRGLESEEAYKTYEKTGFNFGPTLEKTQIAIDESTKQYQNQVNKGYEIYEVDFNPGTNMHDFFMITGIQL